jgi:hypothetical protein
MSAAYQARPGPEPGIAIAGFELRERFLELAEPLVAGGLDGAARCASPPPRPAAPRAATRRASPGAARPS